jgi:hypothetical protein
MSPSIQLLSGLYVDKTERLEGGLSSTTRSMKGQSFREQIHKICCHAVGVTTNEPVLSSQWIAVSGMPDCTSEMRSTYHCIATEALLNVSRNTRVLLLKDRINLPVQNPASVYVFAARL